MVFSTQHLIIKFFYLFFCKCKSHFLNSWVTPTINPSDAIGNPRGAKQLICNQLRSKIRKQTERRQISAGKKGCFPFLRLRNVLAKVKAIIQTQMPTFEKTMTGQIATSGPGLGREHKGVSFLQFGPRSTLTPPHHSHPHPLLHYVCIQVWRPAACIPHSYQSLWEHCPILQHELRSNSRQRRGEEEGTL